MYRKTEVNGQLQLHVSLDTEFGEMRSGYTKATGNLDMDRRIHDSIADDLIDAYEDKARFNKAHS